MDRMCVGCVYYSSFWCSKNAKRVKPHGRCSAWCDNPAEARSVPIPERLQVPACRCCYHAVKSKEGGLDRPYCTQMGDFVQETVYSCSVEKRNNNLWNKLQAELEKNSFQACCSQCKNLRFYVEATGKFMCSKRAGQWETSDIDAKWDCSDFTPGESKRNTGGVQRTVVRVSCVPGGV